MFLAARSPRPVVLAAAVALVAAVASAQSPTTADIRLNTSRSGLMVDGYDVVAYFTESRPVRGRAEFEHQWQGARWRFASAAHRDAFAASPEKYAPQYGGFCAYAVSRNYTADIDPEAWMVQDGRLILNYSLEVRGLFQQDTPGNIRKADANWPGLSRSKREVRP
jgi:hypothetical protein